MNKNNINLIYNRKSAPLQPFFRDSPFFGTNFAGIFFESDLCLPSGSILKDEDVSKVCSVVK
ncbi:MAG: hypothetical protein LBT25_11910 [Candidatus Symbiothrix sp.]|nr:hypothetical protein [Candidatus Symbiothrix sp.]